MSEQDRALALRTTLDVDDAAATKRTGQLLKHRGGLFPQDLTEAQAATLARLSLLYGLDPLFEELTVLQGKVYLTLKGAMRFANDHPKFRGIECAPATPAERTAFRARDDEELWVARVHRSDRDVPTVAYGRASATDDQPVARRWTQEMASKRARHRALRDAFSLPVPGLEEAGDPVADAPRGAVLEGVSRPVDKDALREIVAREVRELREPGREAPTLGEIGPEPIRNDQISAIHAIGHAIGWITRDDDTPYRDALMATFGVVTSKDLSAQQAAAFIEVLVREQEDTIVADAPARSPADSPRLRDLVKAMDPPEAPDWPTPATPTDVARLRARAAELGLSVGQLGGLIEHQYGEGVGLEHLDRGQIAALLALLSTGEIPTGTPQELPL